MDRLNDIEAFLAIVDKGSLTGAARHLRRSLQSVSRSLAALERGLAVELVRRTTRHSQPTDAGLAFYRRAAPAFAEIDRGAARGDKPAGRATRAAAGRRSGVVRRCAHGAGDL